ncbi:MAG: hypothetical protein K0U74_12100 [Alphaproteobacteria bacterium]|nr:hypothetical protein [Alphaproteobacteria bacterium]
MSSKTIPFKQPGELPKPADDWVGAPQQPAATKKPKVVGQTKRLTVDVPENLHRRIKVHCAGEGTQISDVVRDLLLEQFPNITETS